MSQEPEEKLLSVKELAAALSRSERYVYYMCAKGFPMDGGRATLSAALRWLRRNPRPCGGLRTSTGDKRLNS